MSLRTLFGARPSNTMPADVRHAFPKILYHTLISIRLTNDSKVSFALADHAHNIPDLIDRYTPENLRYYWEVERPCFVEAMQRLGDRPPPSFEEHWSVVQTHYDSLSDAKA